MVGAGKTVEAGKYCVGVFVHEERKQVRFFGRDVIQLLPVLVDFREYCGSSYEEAEKKAAAFDKSKVCEGCRLLTARIPPPGQEAADKKAYVPVSENPSTVEKWPKNGTTPEKKSPVEEKDWPIINHCF